MAPEVDPRFTVQQLIEEDERAEPGLQALVDAGVRRQELIRSLAERRARQNLSQRKVGKAMGTSQAAIARLESGGADPRMSTLERYAAVLGARIGAEVLDDENASASAAQIFRTIEAEEGQQGSRPVLDEAPWQQVEAGGWPLATLREAVEQQGNPDLSMRAALSLGRALAELGDMEGAEKAYRYAWEHGDGTVAATAAYVVGGLAQRRKDFALAEKALSWAVSAGEPTVTSKAKDALARIVTVGA